MTVARKQTAKSIDVKSDLSVSAFSHQQNLVRGTLAKVNSTTHHKSSAVFLRVLRAEIGKNLISARALLPVDRIDEYLKWLEDSLRTLAPIHFTKPIGFDYVGGIVLRARRVGLDRELKWIARRIANDSTKISKFRSQCATLEKLIFKSRWSDAIECLIGISNEFGETYWGIQLQIALVQLSGGLEKQKTYKEELRRRNKRGPLSFIAYFTSARNEERVSWKRYLEMVERSVDVPRHTVELKNYLRFRLCSVWPQTERGIADVLRLEQSHSIIDLYETLISLLQHIVTTPSRLDLAPLASRTVQQLEGIADFRLDKLRLALGITKSGGELEPRSLAVSEALFSGNIKKSLISAQRESRASKVDPWRVIYAAMARAHFDPPNRQADPQAFQSLIASVFRRDQDCMASFDNLEKGLSNLSGVPFVEGLRSFCRSLKSSNAQNCLDLISPSLNSAFVGPEDYATNASVRSALLPAIGQPSEGEDTTAKVWRAIAAGEGAEAHSSTIRLARALFYFGRDDHRESIECLCGLEHLTHGIASLPVRFLSASVLASCYIFLGNRGDIIRLIAEEASENELAPAFLPVANALRHFTWHDYKPLADGLTAAIALDALWRSNDDDDEVATMLRFAFSYQLKRSRCELPSEFADQHDMFEKKKLIYYLRWICVPSVMDMSRAFKSSREVTQERQAVCAVLKDIDPKNAEEYDNEIYEITNQLKIADGLNLVDSSRIHVDTESISRWARRELAEDFARYADLVTAGIGTGGDFNEILREVFATISARQVLFTPDDQADAILADMLARLREEFLSNSDYGLDYFLSKRVRHQSFIGLIRGPLEFAGLITTRESEFGPYRRNDPWLNKFSTLSDDHKSEIQEQLSGFSERFDALLLKIKDTRFQIRSVENPEGIFDLPLNGRMLLIVRDIMQTGLSFDDFLRMTYLLFWGTLEPSLAEARRIISEELKSEISDLFDDLKLDVRELAEHDPAFPMASANITDASVDVQRSIDAASAWFVKPEGQQAVHNFTLNQSLEIAVASALKSHRAFKPEIDLKVSGNVNLQAPDLLLVTDAIFIALDNVKTHCGIKRDVKVSIRCDVDERENVLRLLVGNSVSPSTRNGTSEGKLEQIRAHIAAGNIGKRARKEGGSGFLKLAAALRHSPGGELQFGFLSDHEFQLSVKLKPTEFTVAVIQAR